MYGIILLSLLLSQNITDSVEKVDGLSVAFADWRFNLRMSNTEPVVRLNVESRANEPLMREKTAELLDFMAKAAAA